MQRISFYFLCLFLISQSIVAQEQPPARVMVAAVTQEEVAQNRPFLGLVYYDRQSRASSEVAGLVEEVAIHSGDRVVKGTPLVQLNTDILDTDISLARTRVEQTGLQAELARKNFERQKSLLATRGASQKKYDDAQYDLQNARMEKVAANQTLDKLLLEKKKSTIVAPFDGVILEKLVDAGDWVQQGEPVVSIGSSNDLFVRVPVGEKLVAFIHPGDEVNITLNAFARDITGTIDTIDPRADAKTKNIFIKIRIAPQELIAENMSATVHLPISTKKLLAILPRDALIKFQGKDFVYTVKEDKASILPVNIVTFLGDRVAADNPYFIPGMPVVIEGNERLRPDQPVIVGGEQ